MIGKWPGLDLNFEYFTCFTGINIFVMKKHNLEEDLPPFLRDLKEKKDGFKVPEGYFEDMEQSVFARLKASGDLDQPKLKVTKRPKMYAAFIRPQAALAYAAVLALVLTAIWFFRPPSPAVQAPVLATVELTEDELESYLLENAQEFEPEQLASLNPTEMEAVEEDTPSETPNQKRPAAEDIHPDDLDHILDEMTDEELEQIL